MIRLLLATLLATTFPLLASAAPALHHHYRPVRYDVWPEDSSGDRQIIVIHPAHGFADMGDDFAGEIVGQYKFLIVRRPHEHAFIVVYKRGRILYRIPDERIDSPAGMFEPGETEKAYSFYLSPDGFDLLVVRGICNDNEECYLYHRVGRTTWRVVHHDGMEINYAGLCHYANRYHVDPDRLGSVTFCTRFRRWIWTKRTHAVVLETGAASFVEMATPRKGDLVAAYRITYNLRTGRFSHIVQEQM